MPSKQGLHLIKESTFQVKEIECQEPQLDFQNLLNKKRDPNIVARGVLGAVIKRLIQDKKLAISDFKKPLSYHDQLLYMTACYFFEPTAPAEKVAQRIQQDSAGKHSLYEMTRAQLLLGLIEEKMSLDVLEQLPPLQIDRLLDYLQGKTQACLVEHKFFKISQSGILNSHHLSLFANLRPEPLPFAQANANAPR